MNTLILTIEGMSCMGCVNTVKNLLNGLPGVAGVQVDLASGRVEVSHDPALATPDTIRQTIEGGGYRVVA